MTSALLSALGILAVDLFIPLGMAIGVFYVVPVGLTVGAPSAISTMTVAALSAGLTWIGFLFSPPGGDPTAVLANRLLSLVAIGFSALALVVYKHSLQARERAEREGWRLVEATLAAAPDGMVLVGPDGNIERANQTLHRLLRVPPDSLVGKHVDDILPPTLRGRHAHHRETTSIEVGAPPRPMGQGPYRIKRADGREMLIDVRLSALESDGKRLVAASVRDITEQRKIELRLEQTQRMEAVGRLAGGIAHDFNNLLTVIMSHATFARDTLPANSPALEDIDILAQASERAQALTAQILAFSRRQILRPETLSLGALVDDLGRLWRRVLGEDIELVLSTGSETWPVNVDPTQLERALMNLVVNAREAMPRGGKLTIELANTPLDAEYTESHPDVTPGDYIQIAVSDTGRGISEADRTHIFEPFYSTKPNGTGLGLASAYGIVLQAGGHLWVYSEPGHGSTFKLYLPRAVGEIEKNDSHEAAPAAPAPSRGETILLVEDEPSVQAVAARALRRAGYEVLVAADGEQALEIFEERQGRIDLLLTDVVMPRMGGREVAEALQREQPDLRVLFMSGYTDNAIVHNGELAPEVVFLQKPFVPSQLVQKVRERLDARE